jgi:hypothetical protein
MKDMEKLLIGGVALLLLYRSMKDSEVVSFAASSAAPLSGGSDKTLAVAPNVPGSGPPPPPGGHSSGPSTYTGKNIFPPKPGGRRMVVSYISGHMPEGLRDNIAMPCDMVNRESTWIWQPNGGGHYSLKLGSHGNGPPDNGKLYEWTQNFGSGGGQWRCEGPHKSYGSCKGQNIGSISVKSGARVGHKAVTYRTPGGGIHVDLYWDSTGTGNSWVKFATLDDKGGGCSCNKTPIGGIGPIPSGVNGAHCQDTMRVDDQKPTFWIREMHEITPPAGVAASKFMEIIPPHF